ncbi:hypothetical protein Pyrde_0845 [Pyrodictium delaneyi]|uniref:Uncharacterized protein n=1 Tax=Pyrodictium delaneyi TaxID=1273541 RepID=A0A0P0N305_9CREN|nr:hypothetical protein [Pyrodictium delaneyi]ALL00895.1 hypothetical protein Pyrde_0845 [Pyrodictium delaneyi]
MAVGIVVDALAREARLLRAKLRMYETRISRLEEKYGMSSSVFLEKFERGELGDDEDYFLWWSYLRARRVIEERLRELEKELQRLQRLR